MWPRYRGKRNYSLHRFLLRLASSLLLQFIHELTCLYLWLGFFVDINLFTGNNGRTAELPKVDEVLQKSINSTLGSNSLAETGLG